MKVPWPSRIEYMRCTLLLWIYFNWMCTNKIWCENRISNNCNNSSSITIVAQVHCQLLITWRKVFWNFFFFSFDFIQYGLSYYFLYFFQHSLWILITVESRERFLLSICWVTFTCEKHPTKSYAHKSTYTLTRNISSRVIRHVWIPNCILCGCTTVSLEFGVWWSFKSIQNMKKTRQPKKLMWFSLHPPEEDGFSMHYSSSHDRAHALKSVRRNFLVFQREKRCDQKLFPLNY